jgi:hypothetical protein
VGLGEVVTDLGHEIEPFLGGQRAERGPHGLDDVADGVLRQDQLHAPGFDLRQVEHVVDETQQVLAIDLDVGQRLLDVGRHLAVQLVQDHLREAQDGVHRRAQLVAHVGQEGGLGPAGLLELQVQRAQRLRGLLLLGVQPGQLAARLVQPGASAPNSSRFGTRTVPPK